MQTGPRGDVPCADQLCIVRIELRAVASSRGSLRLAGVWDIVTALMALK